MPAPVVTGLGPLWTNYFLEVPYLLFVWAICLFIAHFLLSPSLAQSDGMGREGADNRFIYNRLIAHAQLLSTKESELKKACDETAKAIQILQEKLDEQQSALRYVQLELSDVDRAIKNLK